MKDKHICSATINDKTSRDIMSKMISGQSYETCGCSAKYFEDNEWFCGKHAPSKIQERSRKSYEKWKSKIELVVKSNN